MIRSFLVLCGAALLASCASTPGKGWDSEDPLERIERPAGEIPQIRGEFGVNTQVGF